MLGPAHAQRDRIDRVLGSLIGVGVAEAHELEKRVEQAAATDSPSYGLFRPRPPE
jgi:hypothetical protein